MKLEAVGRVSVRDLGFEVCGEVDDVYGTKRAFLWANAASNTESFRYVGNFGLWSDFDTELASSHYWARFLAFLSAFLWLAFIAIHDSDSCQFVSHFNWYEAVSLRDTGVTPGAQNRGFRDLACVRV